MGDGRARVLAGMSVAHVLLFMAGDYQLHFPECRTGKDAGHGTTREKPSSSAGFTPISSAGRSATNKALQLKLSNSMPRPTLLLN